VVLASNNSASCAASISLTRRGRPAELARPNGVLEVAGASSGTPVARNGRTMMQVTTTLAAGGVALCLGYKYLTHRAPPREPSDHDSPAARPLSDFAVRRLEHQDFTRGLLQVLQQLSPAPISQSAFDVTYHSLRDDRDWLCLVVEEIATKRVVATGTLWVLRKFTYDGACVGQIEDVVTDRAVRGNGIGGLLMRQLVTAAQQRGCRKIILQSSPGNLDWYNRLGFTNKKSDATLTMLLNQSNASNGTNASNGAHMSHMPLMLRSTCDKGRSTPSSMTTPDLSPTATAGAQSPSDASPHASPHLSDSVCQGNVSLSGLLSDSPPNTLSESSESSV
jgi:glucosamine-phosphate N-acetyltransferase